jgi:hypothetical protein
VPHAAQLRTVLWGQLNDRHKVGTNLLRDDDVRTVEDEGRQFVVVNVPRASRLQRPDHHRHTLYAYHTRIRKIA